MDPIRLAAVLFLDGRVAADPQRRHHIDDHTLKFLRSGELIRVDLFARKHRDIWESKGAKSPAAARDKAKTILAKHQVPPLEDAVAHELRGGVTAADAGAKD